MNNRIKIPLRQKTILIIFGLFLTLVILEIGLRLGGFIILSLQERRNFLSIKQRGDCRIICFGESTTQGQYPPYLEEILNQSNTGIRFSVIDKGRGGTSTGFILSQLEANLDKYQPDLVVTMMGINDYGTHMPYEADSTTKIVLFLGSFRTYKLARLLWLHMITKAKEMGFYKLQKNIRFIHRFENSLQKGGLKTAYTEEDNGIQNEINFEKALELNPQNDKAYAELGWLYRGQGKNTEAEEAFKKALELNPQSDKAYAELGRLYVLQGRNSEAEETLKKALELNPENYRAYTGLSRLYVLQGRNSEAEERLKEIIELNPWNYQIYAGLGRLYIMQEKPAEAEEAFKRAVELNPKNYRAYAELGWFYINHGKPAEAEEAFKKALELNPQSDKAYTELGRLYIMQGKPAEAEEAFKKVLELNPQNYEAYESLAVVYGEMGNYILRKECEARARHRGVRFYAPLTINNYRRFKQILNRRKIKWICAQYPGCSIEPLKKIFEGEEGIFFVDNEGIFKRAVLRESYREYFRDIFGDDFGHCTEKGNRLLAENIANVILKEVFGK